MHDLEDRHRLHSAYRFTFPHLLPTNHCRGHSDGTSLRPYTDVMGINWAFPSRRNAQLLSSPLRLHSARQALGLLSTDSRFVYVGSTLRPDAWARHFRWAAIPASSANFAG